MSGNNPTIREDLNIATPMRLADLLRDVRFGDLLIQALHKVCLMDEQQSARIAQAGASPFVATWEALEMRPPAAAADVTAVHVNGPGGDERVAQADITTTQISITGGADTEALQVTVFGKFLGSQPSAHSYLTVAANAATLPVNCKLLDVIACVGTTLGRKTLKIGPSSVIPAAGEVVWDGARSLRFAAADAVTKASVLFLNTETAPAMSALDRTLGQTP